MEVIRNNSKFLRNFKNFNESVYTRDLLLSFSKIAKISNQEKLAGDLSKYAFKNIIKPFFFDISQSLSPSKISSKYRVLHDFNISN